MTREEQKILEKAAKDYTLDNILDFNPELYEAMNHTFKAGANWQKSQMMKDAVEGWVAVDADTVGNRRVSFFPQKPVRDLLTRYKYWAATRPNYEVIRLDSDAFPDIKWEDEPKKVRIVVLKEEEE